MPNVQFRRVAESTRIKWTAGRKAKAVALGADAATVCRVANVVNGSRVERAETTANHATADWPDVGHS